jgi:alcohol dehydrogenase class IV
VTNLLKQVEHLNRTLKIPSTLKEWGADPAQVKELWDDMIAAAMADVTTSMNPRPVTEKDVDAILHSISGR